MEAQKTNITLSETLSVYQIEKEEKKGFTTLPKKRR